MRTLYSVRLLPLAAALVFFAGCSGDPLTEASGPDRVETSVNLGTAKVGVDGAPRSAERPVLRHPQLMDKATSRLKRERPGRAAQRGAPQRITERNPEHRLDTGATFGEAESGADALAPSADRLASRASGVRLEEPVATPLPRLGDEQAHLFFAFNEYEEDGVTPRILDQWGITRRIMQEYGITRRVLQEYGITRRVMQEYGITRRVMQEYGGLTIELLEAYGITQRIMTDYGVTLEELEVQLQEAESALRLRLRVSMARPGISVSFGSDLLDTVLEEIQDDTDIEFAEPDAEMDGGSFYLRDGFKKEGQMVPWNTARISGVFTDSDEDVHVFLLDSGIYDRDLNIVEAKDFTMLFVNRDEETWDDEDFIDMPVFDPGEAGDPVDRTGHGTHVAGTVGAKNNDEGIRGMMPEAKLHSLKVLTDQGRTDVTTVVAAIDYVTDFKQQNPLVPVVANLSLGMDIGTAAYNVLDEAIKRATQFGVTVVVSAGNNGADATTYSPAHVTEAITVGAYDQEDRFVDFSNYGSVVDLLAPGDLVVSLTHLESEADADENILMSGTSMAAPHVTAAAALYLSQNPQASPQAVQAALVGYSQPGIAAVPDGTTDRTIFAAFADDGETKPFRFTKAEYDSENGTLKLEGEGPRIDEVVFRSVATGEDFASTVVMEDGKFALVLPQQEALFPCSVVAIYDGPTLEPATATLAVIDKREEGHPPLTDCVQPLAFGKAEWKEGDSELKFEGTAPQGYEIAFTAAGTGDLITMLTPDDKGKFKFGQKGSTVKPCVIRATLPSGVYVDFPVQNAAADCGSGSGEEIPVQVTKAEWDRERARLTIEGTASRDALVTASSEVSGSTVGTDDADNDGRFKIEVNDPAVLPCAVRVESNSGQFTVVDVIDKERGTAPSKCEAPLQVNKVEWKENDQKLEIQATGIFNGQMQVHNGRDDALLHILTFDHEGKLSAQITNPAVVPCSVRLESGGVTQSLPVQNAALYCDRDLTVAPVQWVNSTRTLSVSGTASATTPVTLFNANTDGEITSVDAQTSGAYGFSLLLTEGMLPPCRVRIEASNGMTLAQNVPTNTCDPNFVWDGGAEEDAPDQNPYSFIEIGKAEIKNGRLLVEGNGYVNMAVQVRNPYTGEFFGQTQTDLDEDFRLDAPIPGVMPCTVEAELDGRITVAEVNGAPDNCNDRPFIHEAKWNNGELLVEGVGGAGMSVTLVNPALGSFYNAVFSASGTLNLALDASEIDWVPCDLRLESNDQEMTIPVDGAPDHCDAQPQLTKAEFKDGGLLIEAAGGLGAGFTLSSVGSGVTVASGQFGPLGTAEQTFTGLSQIPCTVRLTADNGQSVDLLVRNAPVFCDGQAWIDFGKAEWKDGELKLEGEGFGPQGQEQMAVTFTDGTSGAVLHTTETEEAEWQIVVDLATSPCSVTATLGDASATLPVDNAPDSCTN